MKDSSRLLRKLRRKVYRETPVATWNRAAEVDWHGSYDSLASLFESGDSGVLSGGAAMALWRAATDAGFRAWCYDFGFPESLTYMVTVIEADGRLQVHDAFLNLEYRGDFYEILGGLRADRLPDIRRESRDRKIYVADPACESQQTLDWLTAHADRELDRQGSLRRFEVLWDSDAFLASFPRTEAIFRDLESRGHPADFSYLMLHPIAVFDGAAHHRERETMPLVGGLDLHTQVAGLRAAMHRLTRELAGERAQLAERSAAAARLEAEIAEARAELAAAAGEAGQNSAEAAQLREGLADANRQLAAERLTLAQEKTAIEERGAALEAALAEARASHSAVAEQARRLEDQIVQLRSARDEFERAAAAVAAQWAQERQQLLEGARTLDEDNRKLQAAVAETRADLAAVRSETGELRATIDRRTAEWDEERERSREAAQALEGDVLRLREELAQTSAQLGDAQAEGAQLRADLERSSAQWGDERRSLQASLTAVNEDAQTAFAEWARAQLHAEQAAAQATWSGLQVAELVEREAAAAGELAQSRDETTALRALQSELGSADLELRERDRAIGGFVFGVSRLLGAGDLPSDDLAALLLHLRHHIRTLERELDRAEADRGRLDAMLRQSPAQQTPAAGRLRKFLGLLVRPGNQSNRLADGQYVQASRLSRKAS